MLVKMKSTTASFVLPSILLFCTALLVRVSTADVLGNETDRLALLAFKDQITQGPGQAMSSWNSSIHFCEWEGVTCSSQRQRVIALNLQSQGLTGSLSPYIGNLSFLRSIILQNNSLQGKIPQEVSRLFRLEHLSLSNNSFSDQIPVNLSQCSNLVNLSFSYNELVGNIPVEFGSFPKLVRLFLYSNNFSGIIPASLGNLSFLETIVLGRNRLVGSIPESLGQLRKLVFFSLGQNMLSGTVPPLLYNISSLLSISVPINQLEGSLPQVGINLPNLQNFFIGGNNFSGTIPISFITNVSGLQKLDLSFNNLVGKVPVEVGTLKGLGSIQLDSNELGNGEADDLDFITSLTNCTNLQVLSVALNRFGAMLPTTLAYFSNALSAVYLGGNQISGSIPLEIGNLVSLVVLTLEDNLMTGIIPESIGMLQKLQLLSLSKNRLTGGIPNSLGNISQLYYLALSDNRLEGNISSLEKCQSLQIFNLSYNHLTGTIPNQLLVSLSERLTTIILAHNSFIGPLPLEVGNLQNLQRLDVSDNNLSDAIPSTLGSCLSLESLYLQGNSFQGLIPSSFSSLKIIQQVDLSRNKLSGRIPTDLEELPFLKYLNLSFNNFEGEVPMKGVFQNVSAFSVVGNDNICGGIPALDLLKCQIQQTKKQGLPLALKVTIGLVIPLFGIASFLFVVYWRKRHKPVIPSSNLFLESIEYPGHRLKSVSYNELWQATNGFSSENLIGIGSYGSVYKGVLRQDESPIAVKVLNLMEHGATKSFMAECEVLRRVRHRNLLKIITVCSSLDSKGNEFKALVFEFMSNGSVEDWLHPRSDRLDLPKQLNLLQRLNIAIHVASALDYLHNHCEIPIVHCDLKASNILLDDEMVAYVGDFGLAKFLPKKTDILYKYDTTSAGLRGTIGYIPPEYGMGTDISTHGDMYSYGILLLEMFTGKRPTDEMFKDGLGLHNFSKLALSGQVMDIVDKSLLEKAPNKGTMDIEEHCCTMGQVRECLTSIIRIGVACSSGPISQRLGIGNVLEGLLSIKEDCFGTGIQTEDFKFDF